MSDSFCFIGGGVGSIVPAYDLQRAFRLAGRPEKVTVITDEFNSPIIMGASHFTRGITGLEGDKPHPLARQLFPLTRKALWHIERLAALEIGDRSGLTMGYHFLGIEKTALKETRQWLHDIFGYDYSRFHFVNPEGMLRFEGFSQSLYTPCVGQLNLRPFLLGLVKKIEEYGGQVITNTTYLSHEERDGSVSVITDKTEFKTSYLHIATGAEHSMQLGLPGRLIWTGAVHYQLTPEEMKKYFPNGPVAFVDSRGLSEDPLWGGVNGERILTLGRGDKPSWEQLDEVRMDLANVLYEMAPELGRKYNHPSFSWNPIFYTPNYFPYAGRVSESGRVLVNTGWGGRANTPACIYGNALVDLYLRNNDKTLRLLESLNLDALRKEVREPPQPGRLFGRKAVNLAP